MISDVFSQKTFGFQSSNVKQIRVMSEKEIQEKQKELQAQRMNSAIPRRDSSEFFMEYLSHRDTKASSSVTKMAKVMSETKADDLSKSVSKDSTSEKTENTKNISQELGISSEDLQSVANEVGGIQNSELLQELADTLEMQTQLQKLHSKVSSIENEMKSPTKSITSTTLREHAMQLVEQAQALSQAPVTTGKTPDAIALRQKSEFLFEVADLMDLTQTNK